MDTVSVERARMLALELRARLGPLLHHRGVHPAVVGDVVARAIQSGKFEISDGGAFLDHRDPADWLDDLARDPEARHLFERAVAEPDQQTDQIAGMSREAFEKLSARRKLEIANAMGAK